MNYKVTLGKTFSIYFQGKKLSINNKDSWKRRSDASLVLNNWLRSLYEKREVVTSFDDLQTAVRDFSIVEISGVLYFKIPKTRAAVTIFPPYSEWVVTYYINKMFEVR